MRHGPRPIDVDLLLLGDEPYASRAAHAAPRAGPRTRRFVLIPLLELDLELRRPTARGWPTPAAHAGRGGRAPRGAAAGCSAGRAMSGGEDRVHLRARARAVLGARDVERGLVERPHRARGRAAATGWGRDAPSSIAGLQLLDGPSPYCSPISRHSSQPSTPGRRAAGCAGPRAPRTHRASRRRRRAAPRAVAAPVATASQRDALRSVRPRAARRPRGTGPSCRRTGGRARRG